MSQRFYRSVLGQAVKAMICFELIFSPFLINAQVRSQIEISTEFDEADLFGGFENNRIPDLNDIEQREVFTLYLKQKFLGDTSAVTPEHIEEMRKVLEGSPDLSKISFPSVVWQKVVDIYPVNPELKVFLQQFNKMAGKWRALYIQPAANIGDWLKTKYQGQNILDEDAFVRIFPANYLKDLKNIKFDFDKALRELVERIKGENIPDLAKNFMIAAAIHVYSFDDYLKAKIKLPDAQLVLSGLKELTISRDTSAKELTGYSFDELLSRSDANLKYPLMNNKTLVESIEKFEKSLGQQEDKGERVNFAKLIRPLSLVEAPFRSCLAQDCASNSYFTKGLDPNFIYFTIQEENGWSGHVTIALGEVTYKGEKKKIAFIDKIQKINLEDLEEVLEGIRQSCLKMGYELAIPIKLGDHNGISNDKVMRTAVGNLPTFKDQEIVYKGFKPHSHDYRFDELFSRANAELKVKPLLPSSKSSVKYVVNEAVQPKEYNEEKLQSLYEIITISFQLKNGDLEKQKKYFDVMETLIRAKLPTDPQFKEFINECITNKNIPISLRYRAMTHLLMFRNKKLDEAFTYFSSDQIVNLVQNWLQKSNLAEKALASNVAWRAFSLAKIPIDTLLKFENEFVPSAELKVFLQDSLVLTKARALVQNFMQNPFFQHNLIYTYIHQLVLLIEAGKIALERNQDQVVKEIEGQIFKIMDKIQEKFQYLQGKGKKEFAKMILQIFKDPNSPFDEVLLLKYLNTHYKNTSSKAFWYRAKRTYIPGVIINSLWVFCLLSYIGFGFDLKEFLVDSWNVSYYAATQTVVNGNIISFIGGGLVTLFSVAFTNPHAQPKKSLKELYTEIKGILKKAACELPLTDLEEDSK